MKKQGNIYDKMKILQLGNDFCSNLSIRRINNGVKPQTDYIVLSTCICVDFCSIYLLIVGWKVITP